MIAFLNGKLLDVQTGASSLALTVGVSTGSSADSGTVGYLVHTPSQDQYLGLVRGKRAELFVHTVVREDALDLYGFLTAQERELFLILLGVTGIGPRAAIGVLSKVGPDQLIETILTEDKAALTRVPGIGKKTAERIVLELADPLKKKIEKGVMPAVQKAAQVVGSGAVAGLELSGGATFMDARDALMGLGYRESDVVQLLKDLWREEPESSQAPVEQVVRHALQRLV